MTLPQRRLPVGAEILPSGEVHFRVWAPRRRSVEVVLEGAGGRPLPLPSEDGGYFSGSTRDARAGLALPVPPRRRRQLSRPRVALPAATGRTVRRRSSIPAPTAGATPSGRASRCRGQVLYEMHIGTFTPEGTWDAARRELPALRDLGITVHRGDAGGRLRRPLRLGLRRRRPLRADPALRAARRLPRLRGRGARPRARGDPRRRLQPPRPRRELPRASSPSATSPTATARNGASPSTTTARTAARCASSSSPTPSTGSPSSTSTACGSTPPSPCTTPRREHVLAAIARETRRGGAAALDHPRGRERAAAHAPRAAGRAGRLRARRPLERRLPSQRDGRPHRPQRGVLLGLPRARRRSSSPR